MSNKKNNGDPQKPLEDAAEDIIEQAEDTAEDVIEEAEDTAEEIAEEAGAADADEKPADKPKKHVRTSKEEAERALNKVKRRKKLKYGTLATVITLVVIAIVVVLNVITNVLDKRYNWNIDLTSSGLYEIDEQTVEYLHQLSTDVDIAVMADESYYNSNDKLKVVQETLNRFQAESNGHITLQYIDMTKNPDAVKPYSQYYSGEFGEGDVVLKNGELVRAVTFDDLIKQEQNVDYTTYQYVTKYTFIGEQNLVSALMGVTDLNPVHIAFIDKMNGVSIYNEYDQLCYQRMQELLEKNNYVVTSVDISTASIPEECTVAILCGPSNDLTEAQIQKLSDFLSNNGQYERKLMYFASPYQPKTPKLDEFLEVWGIEIEQSLVLESDSASAQYVQIAVGGRGITANNVPIVSLTASDLNANAVSSKLPLVAPYCRYVKQLFETNSGRTTEPLLLSAGSAYLYPLDADENFDPSSVDKSSYNAAVVATQSFSIDGVVKSSKLVAFGSAWFTDYVITNMSSYDNANYFITLVNTMTGKENAITIAEKSLENTTITVSENAIKGIRIAIMFIIPLIVAVIGVVVYFRRKNK